MKVIKVSRIALCAFAILFFGCSDMDDEPSRYEQFIADSVPLDSTAENHLSSGDIVYVALEGNGSTGYWWYYTISDQSVVSFLESDTFNFADEDIVGGPVTGIWKFECGTAGSAVIVFDYFRSWEGIESSVNTKTFSLSVE